MCNGKRERNRLHLASRELHAKVKDEPWENRKGRGSGEKSVSYEFIKKKDSIDYMIAIFFPLFLPLGFKP